MKNRSIHSDEKSSCITLCILNLCFLIMWAPSSSVAQKTDKTGYVVTNEGDTVTGMFSASRWDVSPKQVAFNGPNGKEVYKPADIKSFYVAGEFYASAIVDVDHSIVNLQKMNYSSKPEFIRDTLFVQIIYSGSKSLYYHKNANDWKYFFIKDGVNPIEQLVYKKYLLEKQEGGGTKTYAVENNFYIRQLKVLFSACPTLGTTVDNAKYEINNLENIFKKYAKCAGEEVEEVENPKRFRFDLQGIVGLNVSSVKFYSNHLAFRTFTEGDFQSKISPDIGLGLSVNSLRRDRLLVNVFLLYNNLNVSGYHYSDIENKETTMAFRYNCFSANLNFGIRPIRSIPLYLTFGFTMGFLNETQSEWVERYRSGQPREKEFKSSSAQSGFISSIVYQIDRIGFEFMYEHTNGFSNFLYLGCDINRFHFIVKYNILKREE